jgi:hypothetical protein
MDTGNVTVATEAGPINGAISLACNGIFCFAKACNQAGVGGYSDWRVMNTLEMGNLWNRETLRPNATAFPSLTTSYGFWTSTTTKDITTYAEYWVGSGVVGAPTYTVKTGAYYAMLVRGGV